MTARKGKKRSQKRKPTKFNLALTNRMKAHGHTGKWRYMPGMCPCGGRLATDGETTWCVGGVEWMKPIPVAF